MADQHESTAELLAEVAEFGHNLTSHGDIKAGGGLIGDDQRRIESDC